MPRVPTVSPATGRPTTSSFIHTIDCNFVDNSGRTLLLRGVNLSGASKAPVGQPSFILDDFWEAAEEGGDSFIGRPLNIDDGTADIHLARLSGWGFNMLRFPVTWESLEHEGPGIYDYEFMDYTVRVLQKCKAYGFKVYMDPHQDIWSRFSGGSGAPYWTLPACGINPRNFTATQSAILHCEYPLAHDPDPASLPAMIWSTNYGRLASQTIFTLFFAGRDFAPKCVIDGKNIQDYLQEHYIEAMGQMADRIRDAGGLIDECVLGWDSMNEPFEGFCGWPDLNFVPQKQGSTLKKGTYPTPAQSLRLGMGQAQTVENWTFGTFGPARDGTVTIDPKGRTMWADPETEVDGSHPRWGWKRDPAWKLGECLWAQHGVWDIESGYVMRPDYFRLLPNTEEVVEVEFIQDYWLPHWQLFSKRIRAAQPEAIMFVQPPVFARPPQISEEELKGRCAYSAHYYDGLTLVTRHWNWFNADALGLLRGKYSTTLQAVKIGEKAIRKSLQEQLGMLKGDTAILGSYPTLIGEIGTPFDMDSKRSYGWTDDGRYKGDYSRQERALDASLNGADGGNAINWTIWTYVPDHTHDWGDMWNMEDLSLWSADDLRQRDDAESLYMGNESQAGLLKKKQHRIIDTRAAAAAVSSLSLATLGLGAGAVFDDIIRSQRPAKEIAGWHDNPYDFLTDGARGVRAFCRPWPTRVVGRTVDMNFDIAKATFRLVVSVRAQDRPRRDPQWREGDEEPATEIFIPLVHFAHGRLLGERAPKVHEAWPGARTPIGSRNASMITLDAVHPAESFSRASTGTSATAGDDGAPMRITEKEVVDVEVRASEGRWAVEGQTLKWWYDVPDEAEGTREFVLEVRRHGGVVKVKRAGRRSWTERACPNGCSIM